MAFCHSCGAALKLQAKFCSGCGVANAQAVSIRLHPPAAQKSTSPKNDMRTAAIIGGAVVALGLGGISAWNFGLFERPGDDGGTPELSEADLAAISNCVGPYKSALMMQMDAGDITEADLERRARADCSAMTPEQRANYGQGAAAAAQMEGGNAAGTGATSYSTAEQTALGEPSVRLWYPKSQTSSEELVDNPNFELWNVVIGEGSAQEPTDKAIFSVKIQNVEKISGMPLTLTATGPSGEVLAQHKFDNMYFGPADNTFQITVDRIGCAGKTKFEARIGDEAVTTWLDFDCGE
jgi:hypothetical protein